MTEGVITDSHPKVAAFYRSKQPPPHSPVFLGKRGTLAAVAGEIERRACHHRSPLVFCTGAKKNRADYTRSAIGHVKQPRKKAQ